MGVDRGLERGNQSTGTALPADTTSGADHRTHREPIGNYDEVPATRRPIDVAVAW